MHRLVILDVSRIIRGKVRLEKRLVDLVGILESAVDSVQPAAEAKGIEILTGCDDAGIGETRGARHCMHGAGPGGRS